ncbi:MAG: hypothetical protein M3209_20300 [Acidobacteriota bacterium]|nr:hypothetical protein [Acidobacteriota bacterium]
METSCEQKANIRNRENERGAALVTVLLISMLLLVAGSALLFAATMNTANVTDSVAEQQAYYAAESGIQSALNVFRNDSDDNSAVNPNPLIDTTKPVTHIVNEIDYRKAVQVSTSNVPGDTAFPRLSRWLTYDNTGRVPINAQTGQGFRLQVSDPDNTTSSLSYTIDTWKINSVAKGTYTVPGGLSNISYTPPLTTETTNLNVSTNAGAIAKFGSFTITGTGGTIPADGVRFEINYKMTKPYEAVKVIRGTIFGSGAVSSTSPYNIKFVFDSSVLELKGSIITINLNSSRELYPSSATTEITGNVTAVEPQRLVLRSTGFGPRGAQKQLEAIIRKNFFDGLSAPSTLTLVGQSNGFHFNAGSSGAQKINGDDVVSAIRLPPIGVTNDQNLLTVNEEIKKGKPELDGSAANVADELPNWLYNATALHGMLFSDTDNLYTVASNSNRVFTTTPTLAEGLGDFVTGKGITFINGDATFQEKIYGGGILVCTGKLIFKGEWGFRGLIIVTGAAGFERSGGGSGILEGNIVVAPYDKNNLGSSSVALSGFLAPKYDTSGGGGSSIIFNSSVANNGLLGISNFVIGIAEK